MNKKHLFIENSITCYVWTKTTQHRFYDLRFQNESRTGFHRAEIIYGSLSR